MKLIPALQPIINTLNGKIAAYEVLGRWLQGDKILKPHETNPCWVTTDLKMLDLLLDYAEAMTQMPQRLFINVSDAVLSDDEIYREWRRRVTELVQAVGYPVCIEILETVTDDVLANRWGDLRTLPITLALDDFGNGHAHPDRLHEYGWDYCKFVAESLHEPTTMSAVRYCAGRSILMIAEHVESHELKELASRCGVRQHQGFLYYQPEVIDQRFKIGATA